MIRKKIFSLLVCVVATFTLIFTLSPVEAQQPYMAGYLNRSAIGMNRVLVAINYQETLPSQIPAGSFLGGVASVAGANNSQPTGWIFQNGVALYNNGNIGNVYWAPQSWYGGQKCYHRTPLHIGRYNFVAFYERIDISSTIDPTYRLYVYNDFFSYEHDAPTVYYWQHPP